MHAVWLRDALNITQTCHKAALLIDLCDSRLKSHCNVPMLGLTCLQGNHVSLVKIPGCRRSIIRHSTTCDVHCTFCSQWPAKRLPRDQMIFLQLHLSKISLTKTEFHYVPGQSLDRPSVLQWYSACHTWCHVLFEWTHLTSIVEAWLLRCAASMLGIHMASAYAPQG